LAQSQFTNLVNKLSNTILEFLKIEIFLKMELLGFRSNLHI